MSVSELYAKYYFLIFFFPLEWHYCQSWSISSDWNLTSISIRI